MEYIDIIKGYTKKDIEKIAKIIKVGGIAILPTDTVYGFVASALNEEAVKRIYKLKGRTFTNPSNIATSNIEMIKKSVKTISKKEEKLIKAFFPGAITIILKKKKIIPDIVTAGKDTVGVRIPNDKFLLELIETLGEPIIATSCNLAGEKALTNPKEILEKFKNNVECIVDEGISKIGIPSTIVKIQKGDIKILREGPISKEEIERKI